MNKWQKIIVVCISGAAVWGLSYCSSIWPEYGLVTASFATGITALSSMLAGWPPKTS